MEFKFTGKTITKNKEKFIVFQNIISNILVLENSIIVLFDFNSCKFERNVFCYKLNKTIQWQIPQPIKIHALNYYTSIYLINNELYAYSVSGIEYHLNKETGVILDSELIK